MAKPKHDYDNIDFFKRIEALAMNGYTDEEIAELEDIKSYTRDVQTYWAEQAEYIRLVKEGVIDAEVPKLSPTQQLKMLATQPVRAGFEALMEFNRWVAGPSVALGVIGFRQLTLRPGGNTTDAAELEASYNEYCRNGRNKRFS